eukprot:snap_masked-scaffold_1-processed-gene-13.18-mRNA-1 protein AED:1.00 eAED:1.00 QI:0/0/0/0/1/1/2/0/61
MSHFLRLCFLEAKIWKVFCEKIIITLSENLRMIDAKSTWFCYAIFFLNSSVGVTRQQENHD